MKNKLFILLALFFLCSTSYAQKTITWQDLSKVRFKRTYFPEFDEYFPYPIFAPSVLALEGKKVAITGYFLDIDAEGNIFILSKGPMASCFFCGVGGPETAVELHFPSKPPFRTDEIITVVGIFETNSFDQQNVRKDAINRCIQYLVADT